MDGSPTKLEARVHIKGKPDAAGGPVQGYMYIGEPVSTGGPDVYVREVRSSGRPCVNYSVINRWKPDNTWGHTLYTMGSPTFRDAQKTEIK